MHPYWPSQFGMVYENYHQVSNTCISETLVGNCWSLRCSWSIACRRCSNYIFILNLTLGFNILCKDNCKLRRETSKFWDLVHLICIRDFTVQSLVFLLSICHSDEVQYNIRSILTKILWLWLMRCIFFFVFFNVLLLKKDFAVYSVTGFCVQFA